MFSHFATRMIAAFDRRWGYDSSYVRELLDQAGLHAILPWNSLGKISSYRRDVPAPVYHAAKITVAIAADCGPCAQLFLRMARADGVAGETLRALIAGDGAALDADARLGYELARATLARADATAVRAAIRARFGRRALASLAYGMVAAQAYPTLKYALGYGQACLALDVPA